MQSRRFIIRLHTDEIHGENDFFFFFLQPFLELMVYEKMYISFTFYIFLFFFFKEHLLKKTRMAF